MLTALEGGLTNRNFVVAAPDGTECVLRLAGKDTALLGIDREVEVAANRQAAALGIAPDVLHVLMPEGYLVTRFVQGGPVPLITEASVMSALTTALRAFHGSPPLNGAFNCFDIARTYAVTAHGLGVALPAELDRATVVANEVRSVFDQWGEPPVPCHDDLLNANLLRACDGTLLILDWEYAGMGSRWFDLGNLATNHELDPTGRRQLIESYFGAVTAGRMARLELMQVMSDLREAMWGVVQQGISTLEFDFAGYAARHFDRLLVNAGRPGFRHALATAAED